MIVRINQIDPTSSPGEVGWPPQGLSGPIRCSWPAATHMYELLILPQDERNQPLSDSFRQQQLRQIIPQVLMSLRDPTEELVVRLDGALGPQELSGAFAYLTDSGGQGRFAMSESRKLQSHPGPVFCSIRVQPSPQQLRSLCLDSAIGLERSVRLRAFLIQAELVNPLLDIDATDDERWGELLGHCGCVLSTGFGLGSLQLRTARFPPAALRGRVMQSLGQMASR